MNRCRCSDCHCEIHTRIETVEPREYAPEMVEVTEVLTCGCTNKKVVTRSLRVPKNSVPGGWL